MDATKTVPVGITVIEMAARTASRFCAFGRMKATIAAGLVAVVLVFVVPVHAMDYMVGVVTKGAFLLSEEPNVLRDGHNVHGLVGYLPIGTRVYFKDESRAVDNLTEARTEIYFRVYSSIGIEGLLREDLFKPVVDKPVAVVISATTLHNPDPAKGKFRKLLDVGRYDNVYLEITGESDTHFNAVLNRRDSMLDLPKREPVRVWKKLVEKGLVIVVEPQYFDKQTLPVPRWDKRETLRDNFVNRIIDEIQVRFDGELDQVRAFLGDANTIQCLVKATAEAELGFKVFSNGLLFHLEMSFKDYSQMFRLKQRRLRMVGEQQPIDYLLLQNVQCDGRDPERLRQLTLQEGVYDPDNRASVHLKDLEGRPSKWVISLQDSTVPFRMIRIEDEQGYMRVLSELNDLVTAGGSFISESSPNKQDILLNLILREISHFEHRDRRVQSSGS